MKSYVKNIACFLFVATNIFGYGQETYYRQYTEADGLPSMTTYEMVQDSSGLLWIGTENGLVSFDGYEFTSYSHPDLKDNDIIEISLSSDGTIYFFNLSHQLARVVDGEVEILLTGGGQRQNIISTKDKNYVISKFIEYYYQCNKLYELNEDTLTQFNEKCLKHSSREIRMYYWNNAYSSNYPVNRVFYHIKDGDVQFYNAFERGQSLDENGKFKSLHFEGDASEMGKDNFYFGEIGEQAIALLVSDEIFFIDNRIPLQNNSRDIQRIVVFGDNNYIVKQNRLEVFNSQIGKQQLLIDDIVVNTVYEDNENQIWVSTRNRGLIKINQSDLRIISFREVDKIITGICATENNLLLSWEDKLELRNKKYRKVLNFDLQTNKQSTIVVSKDSFLIVTYNKLFSIKSNKLKLLSSTFMNTKSLTIAGDKIVAGNYLCLGIYNINDNSTTLKNLYLTNALSLNYFEEEELLLVGTSKGVFRFDENFDYYPYVPELSSISINNILKSEESFFWIASKTNGLFKIKDEKIIKQFDTSNGLLSNTINDIVIQDDHIYAATTKGISQINIHTHKIVNKNSFNGLPGDHISNICIFNDSILMTIHKDVVIVDNSFFSLQNRSSTLAIAEIYCNNEVVDKKSDLSFDHDQNKIDILLDHISLSSAGNKSIKYRMTDVDTLWTKSQESAIRLSSLMPGSYNLEIVGINAVGVESEQINLQFTINPPWWETLTARISGILLLTALGYGIILYRGRRIRKEESVKRDFLNQINSIKDQALQLQMNPHFIFNSLNAIQSFIGTNEEEKAMNYLARFARLIRLIFEHSKGNSISLEEELEFIQLYLNLEKLRFKDKVRVSLTVDPALEDIKDIIKVPPLLIQPIVENSFKHGLFHKPGKGELKIDYRLMDKVLQVTIQDDGIGREESKLITKRNMYEHISSGIKTTQERIDLLNFRKKAKHNKMDIIDLYKEDGSSNGTKTIIELSV